MTKAVSEKVGAEIRRRRAEVTKLHADLQELEDYLDVLEARHRAIGRQPYTQAELEKRYRVAKQ